MTKVESSPEKKAEPGHQIQVYTGYGKGKTTAAVGLIIRALGMGWRVAMVQFDKGYQGQIEHYAERHILRGFPELELFPTGCERMLSNGHFRFKNLPEDFAEAERGLSIVRELLNRPRHQLVVLDELLAAYMCKLVKSEDIFAILDAYETAERPFELVITGHQLPPGLLERADLVTEMTKVKHYFDKGLPARKGIEY